MLNRFIHYTYLHYTGNAFTTKFILYLLFLGVSWGATGIGVSALEFLAPNLIPYVAIRFTLFFSLALITLFYTWRKYTDMVIKDVSENLNGEPSNLFGAVIIAVLLLSLLLGALLLAGAGI